MNGSSEASWEGVGVTDEPEVLCVAPVNRFCIKGASFSPDSKIDPTRLTGHRQVTDAWLAELARRKGGKLATLDAFLAALWPDATCLIPV